MCLINKAFYDYILIVYIVMNFNLLKLSRKVYCRLLLKSLFNQNFLIVLKIYKAKVSRLFY